MLIIDYVAILFGVLFFISELIGFISDHKGVLHFVFTYAGLVYSIDVRGEGESQTLLEGESRRRGSVDIV
jgi:hypothetical protein